MSGPARLCLLNKDTAITERADSVNGVGDTPNRHDILTGSPPDGTASSGNEDLTCRNWTSSRAGRAQVGHHDRMGQSEGSSSCNSAHDHGDAARTTCSAQAEPDSSIVLRWTSRTDPRVRFDVRGRYVL